MRHPSTRPLAAVLLAVLLASSSTVALASDEERTPQRQLELGVEMILEGLRLFVDRIPQYQTPEVLPNGDIIIRRKHPTPRDDKPEDEEDGDTKRL